MEASGRNGGTPSWGVARQQEGVVQVCPLPPFQNPAPQVAATLSEAEVHVTVAAPATVAQAVQPFHPSESALQKMVDFGTVLLTLKVDQILII